MRWCDALVAEAASQPARDSASSNSIPFTQAPHTGLAVMSMHGTGTHNSTDLEGTGLQPTLPTLHLQEQQRDDIVDATTAASAASMMHRFGPGAMGASPPVGGNELMTTALRVLTEAHVMLDSEARENCLEVLAALVQLPDSTTEKDSAVRGAHAMCHATGLP